MPARPYLPVPHRGATNFGPSIPRNHACLVAQYQSQASDVNIAAALVELPVSVAAALR